jgi:hypothetical protein
VAQVRGHWFPNIRSALERRGMLDAVEPSLPQTTGHILRNAEANAWYDEGHAVAIYETVFAKLGAESSRVVGRDAARFAMASAWYELMIALRGHIGGTPRMLFEQMPVLWNATWRDAGELFVESTSRHAVTSLHGFAYAKSPAWIEAWIGVHEALLRSLKFTGTCALESVDEARGEIRVRVAWGAPIPSGTDSRPGNR